MKKADADRLTEDQQAEIRALEDTPDEQIDTSDIPEVLDWSDAKRGVFYRPVKQQITLRLDADVVAEGSAELEQWVLHRLGRVLEGRAPQVAAGMRGSATKRRLATRKREPVDRCANYLLKYQGYLAYDQYLAAGFPIGSGVIEGACRHLVKDRLGITGARWRLRGAEAVLRLRALRSSGDFDDYWRFHEAQEWQRTHRQRYADGQLPALQPPNNGPRLRIVRD